MECLLETKGGSIQAIRLHDLTGYGTLDLAVGDCDGVVTLFSKQKILSKREVGSAITDIVIDNDLGKAYMTLYIIGFNYFKSGWM